jgi:hypothetical protein
MPDNAAGVVNTVKASPWDNAATSAFFVLKEGGVEKVTREGYEEHRKKFENGRAQWVQQVRAGVGR